MSLVYHAHVATFTVLKRRQAADDTPQGRHAIPIVVTGKRPALEIPRRGRRTAGFGRPIDALLALNDAKHFPKHLATEFPAVCCSRRGQVEPAVRLAVVIGKVYGTNRTRKGARTQEVFATMVRTVRQRSVDLSPLITQTSPACELRVR